MGGSSTCGKQRWASKLTRCYERVGRRRAGGQRIEERRRRVASSLLLLARELLLGHPPLPRCLPYAATLPLARLAVPSKVCTQPGLRLRNTLSKLGRSPVLAALVHLERGEDEAGFGRDLILASKTSNLGEGGAVVRRGGGGVLGEARRSVARGGTDGRRGQRGKGDVRRERRERRRGKIGLLGGRGVGVLRCWPGSLAWEGSEGRWRRVRRSVTGVNRGCTTVIDKVQHQLSILCSRVDKRKRALARVGGLRPVVRRRRGSEVRSRRVRIWLRVVRVGRRGVEGRRRSEWVVDMGRR